MKPIQTGKTSWGIGLGANTCGAYIRTCANTKQLWGIILEMCIRTFARLYWPYSPTLFACRHYACKAKRKRWLASASHHHYYCLGRSRGMGNGPPIPWPIYVSPPKLPAKSMRLQGGGAGQNQSDLPGDRRTAPETLRRESRAPFRGMASRSLPHSVTTTQQTRRGAGRVAPSTGWMHNYVCFSPSTAIGPLAIGSVIGRPYLALSRIHAQVGLLNRLVLNCWGAQPHNSGAIVSKTPLKQARNKNAIEAAILNRVLD